MNTKLKTKLLIALSTLGIIGYDIWVAVEPTDDDTISEILRGLSYDWGIVPFLWGILTGHLFIKKSWTGYKFKSWWRYIYLSASAIGVGAVSYFDLFSIHPTVWLGLGAIAGWMFWPQFEENFNTEKS